MVGAIYFLFWCLVAMPAALIGWTCAAIVFGWNFGWGFWWQYTRQQSKKVEEEKV